MQHLVPWLRLQLTPGLGRVGMIRLIERFKTPEQAIDNAGDWHLAGLRNGLARAIPASTDSNVDNACERLNEMQGRLLTMWDADYPHRLRQISDPPALLYCCGELLPAPALAIVGTRHPTDFGRVFTRKLAGEIAAAGIVIVSGMARGIDSAAHFGALDAAGKTVAVLGCGIDRIYPPENTGLYRQIVDNGALLSEYPPGSDPLPGHFPGRNRIISALSLGTLVIEACRDSGSLITAEFALEQGRDVMAVPGGVDRPTSYGPNLLIKQGAHPITEAEEVIQILGLSGCQAGCKVDLKTDVIDLPEPAGRVLAALGLTPRHSDELTLESGLTPSELSVILLHLELQGYAEKLPGGRYVRGRRALQP
ncbi:MAG: DNA-processing protein DprA [Desulfuromonadales bacterium]|jgi:DNA processing protein